MPGLRFSSGVAQAPIGSRCGPRAASRSPSPENFPTCAWSFGLSEDSQCGRQGDQAPMNDNPFAEPDDNDRTVIRTVTRNPDPRKASPDATTADATVVAAPPRRIPRPARSLLDVNF